MSKTGPIEEVLVMALEGWSNDWMSRQSLSAALSRFTKVIYAGQPRYPSKIRDLFTLPQRRMQDGVTIQKLPCWMNTNFEDDHCHAWLARQLKRRIFFRNWARCTRAMLLWHPSLVGFLDSVSVDVTCYHVVDYFEGLAVGEELRQRLKQQEEQLLNRVDVVFVTWKGLAEKLGVADKAVLLPHGMDFEYYNRVSRNELSIPSDIPRGRPIVGCTGSLKAKTDFELLEKMAQALPDWNIVLIGHNITGAGELQQRFENLLKQANVFYLGLKTRTELAAYLQAFDVCIMPYTITEWMRYGLPLKMFEYFATGKPIVSTYLPSLDDYREYIDVCMNHDDFIEAVADYKSRDTDERRLARLAFAAENTWEKRAQKMLEVLNEAVQKKQS